VEEGTVAVGLHVVSGMLAVLLAYSAALKLSGRPEVLESYARVGVPAPRLPALAVVLLLGAAALVLGWAWPRVGLAAACALVVYFALAVIAHARHRDLAHAGTPAAILTLAIAASILHAIA
jgi:hypothetical protein